MNILVSRTLSSLSLIHGTEMISAFCAIQTGSLVSIFVDDASSEVPRVRQGPFPTGLTVPLGKFESRLNNRSHPKFISEYPLATDSAYAFVLACGVITADGAPADIHKRTPNEKQEIKDILTSVRVYELPPKGPHEIRESLIGQCKRQHIAEPSDATLKKIDDHLEPFLADNYVPCPTGLEHAKNLFNEAESDKSTGWAEFYKAGKKGTWKNNPAAKETRFGASSVAGSSCASSLCPQGSRLYTVAVLQQRAH